VRACVAAGLQQDALGLSRRREAFGANRIRARPMKGLLTFVWRAWNDVTLIILTVAAVLSLGLSFYHPSSSSASHQSSGRRRV